MLKQVEIDDQIYSRIKALGCDVERIGHPHIGEQIYSGGAIVTANPGHCADYIIIRPIPPQMVPLGPEDQIDWVRHKGATDRCRVNLVNQDGVVIETIGHRSWAQLKTHYDRSNDHGKSWSECSKPAP